jgi:pimeloyl-ACP methyl ester carboxylesterase
MLQELRVLAFTFSTACHQNRQNQSRVNHATGFFMWQKSIYLSLAILCISNLLTYAQAQSAYSQNRFTFSFEDKAAFAKLYVAELGDTFYCEDSKPNEFGICANLLKNAGNAARVYVPKSKPQSVIVLFHGLSDSPYFVSSIAKNFQSQGHLVIAPLTPGHGKKDAKQDMKDERLKDRWLLHVNSVMEYSKAYAQTQDIPIFAGGFSTGGTFATWYALTNPDSLQGVLLFSGALALPDSAETMSRIWGIKSVAKWLDGVYESNGPHPFKYPGVASYSALVLLDIINEIRDMLAEQDAAFPIFAAHSMADNITLFSGVENLIESVEGQHVVFKIDEEYDLCHQDLPMDKIQLIGLKFDRNQVNQKERCAIPQANPLHMQMMIMANSFINQQMTSK